MCLLKVDVIHFLGYMPRHEYFSISSHMITQSELVLSVCLIFLFVTGKAVLIIDLLGSKGCK